MKLQDITQTLAPPLMSLSLLTDETSLGLIHSCNLAIVIHIDSYKSGYIDMLSQWDLILFARMGFQQGSGPVWSGYWYLTSWNMTYSGGNSTGTEAWKGTDVKIKGWCKKEN